MNTLVAASLFDNPWVLVAIVILGALSNWLIKRRQRNQAENRPDGDESLQAPRQAQERSPRELDLQDALRQLLGGDPPPRAPQPPPILPVMRDAQPSEVGSDEEQFQREQAWLDEPQETYEAARRPAIATAPLSQPHLPLARASDARTEASDRHEPKKAARRFEQWNESGKHTATAIGIGRGRRSHAGARAVTLVRDARTVRQAFVASLVFGPPKAFES